MFSSDKLLNFEDVINRPDPQPIIANTFGEGDTVILYADYGNGKTFIGLDWAACIATGKPWQGRQVNQARVLYVVAEGAFGFRKRWNAWQSAWGYKTTDQMFIYDEPIDLGSPAEVDALCQTVDAERFGLVVFDTLSQCIAGLDENSAATMSLAVHSMTDVIRSTPGGRGAALALHHTTKSGKTMRGSSSLGGGANVIYSCELDGAAITLNREKNKDGPRHDQLTLRLEAWGDSCIVHQRGDNGNAAGISGGAEKVLSRYSRSFSHTGCSKKQLVDTVKELDSIASSTAYTAINKLVERGALANVGTDTRPFYKPGPHYTAA